MSTHTHPYETVPFFAPSEPSITTYPSQVAGQLIADAYAAQRAGETGRKRDEDTPDGWAEYEKQWDMAYRWRAMDEAGALAYWRDLLRWEDQPLAERMGERSVCEPGGAMRWASDPTATKAIALCEPSDLSHMQFRAEAEAYLTDLILTDFVLRGECEASEAPQYLPTVERWVTEQLAHANDAQLARVFAFEPPTTEEPVAPAMLERTLERSGWDGRSILWSATCSCRYPNTCMVCEVA
jgi:hypothetical protein